MEIKQGKFIDYLSRKFEIRYCIVIILSTIDKMIFLVIVVKFLIYTLRVTNN